MKKPGVSSIDDELVVQRISCSPRVDLKLRHFAADCEWHIEFQALEDCIAGVLDGRELPRDAVIAFYTFQIG